MQHHISGKSILLSYTTPEGADLINQMVEQHGISLIIKKDRLTKLGDYSHPIPSRPFHQITLNGTLNKYAFIITFIHEVAHLTNWNKHKRSVSPHGIEWKIEYHQLLTSIIPMGIFPEDLKEALLLHVKNIKSSSMSDLKLMKVLNKYTENYEEVTTVSDILEGVLFEYKQKQFIRGEKVRTRIKCKCITDKKTYVFHQLAPVEILINDN